MAKDYKLNEPMKAVCPICTGSIPASSTQSLNQPNHERSCRIGAPLQIIKSTGEVDPLFERKCPGSGMTVKPVKVIPPQFPTKEGVVVPKDTDPFPIGKHKEKGHTYAEVPADYFDWFIGQPWAKKWPQIIAYYEANSKAIDKEMKDV